MKRANRVRDSPRLMILRSQALSVVRLPNFGTESIMVPFGLQFTRQLNLAVGLPVDQPVSQTVSLPVGQLVYSLRTVDVGSVQGRVLGGCVRMIQVDQEEGGHVNGESEQKHSTTVVLYETLAGQTEQQAAEYGTTADKATVNADQFDRVITERLRVADGR